jgi:hypothetical protein
MKIHYFEDGITDLLFNFVKSAIMVDPKKFQEFDTVMQLYVNFKRSQKPEAPTHQACNVCAVQGRGAGRQGHGGYRDGRQGGPNAHILRLVPPEEVDKVTIFENKYYPVSVYNKFTLAKKAKNWQLRHPGQTPGQGPSGRETNKSSATVAELTFTVTAISGAVSAISELTAAITKQNAAEEGEPMMMT